MCRTRSIEKRGSTPGYTGIRTGNIVSGPIRITNVLCGNSIRHFSKVIWNLDFLCFKNVSPLLNDYEIVLGRLSPRNRCYQIPNAFLASTPGCPFWINIASEVIAAPQEEQDRIERHTGPLRLESAYYKYEPEGAVVHPQELIYPLDWIDLVCTDTMREANALREKSPEELTTLFPRSYCISFWMHNWQRM
jgi:hypothetical protein